MTPDKIVEETIYTDDDFKYYTDTIVKIMKNAICKQGSTPNDAIDELNSFFALALRKSLDDHEAAMKELREFWNNARNLALKHEQKIQALESALKAKEELHALQLAGIMTASIQNTESSIKERIDRGNPYWTVAYDDVCRAIDREIELQKQLKAKEEEVNELKKKIKRLEDVGWDLNALSCNRAEEVSSLKLKNKDLENQIELLMKMAEGTDSLLLVGKHKWSELQSQLKDKEALIADYQTMHEDHKRLVRELDVAVYGDGASKQASLCDLIMPIKNLLKDKEARIAELESVNKNITEQRIRFSNKNSELESQLKSARDNALEEAQVYVKKWREDHDYEFFTGGDIREIVEGIKALKTKGQV